MSAKDIGKFPDNNPAESLQRIPSVTTDRSQLGKGRQINLQGFGTECSRIEINGGLAPANYVTEKGAVTQWSLFRRRILHAPTNTGATSYNRRCKPNGN